ncbi:HesB/YadR/YfhF family protein [Ureibacillus terrenus]|uniref:HesB/YadR/YfhF family protein n=1 Tax=Ureibacillus terrenus TaxID=118246 RepID=UPI002E1C6000|nr:HesB/YadR/YfhF family protein [Ureibacillus terrenus]
MKIVITDEALTWFKEEMEVEHGDYIRFYAHYGGCSPFHESFSLGMNREKPHDIGVETVVDGIHFFIEKDDEWFFNDHDLHVSVDPKTEELLYEYKK